MPEIAVGAPDGDDFGIPVHCFEVSRRKRICLHVQEYRGHTFLSLREFYLDGNTDSWKPSPRGITIPPEFYCELLRGVLAAPDALGLEPPDELCGD